MSCRGRHNVDGQWQYYVSNGDRGDTTDAGIGGGRGGESHLRDRATRENWPQCGTVKRRGDAGRGEEKGGVLGSR